MMDDSFFDDELNDSIQNNMSDFDNVDNVNGKNKKAKRVKKSEAYNRTQTDIQGCVDELKGNIDSILETIDIAPEDLYPAKDLIPDGLDVEIEIHDYEKDIELIKIDSKETLECIANLYLTDEQMKTKNIYKIIRDDSTALSKLNFSIECAQRALVSCMKQLDFGVNDPDMYQSVALFQKEMRDTIKMTYELQKKMKDFYKELKSELMEINSGTDDNPIPSEEENLTIIGDSKMLNDFFDKMKDNPELLNELNKSFKPKK